VSQGLDTGGRLSRAERQALQKEDARRLAAPLDLGPDPRSIDAHLRQLVRLLKGAASASPCSDAVRRLTAVYDGAIPAQAKAKLACRKGCGHCCSQPVSVTAAEALAVAAAVRRRPEGAAAVAAFDAAMRALPARAGWDGSRRCPMLVESACSIYAARPLACHAFVSADLQACLSAFVERKTPQIPMPAEFVNLLYPARMMLMAALRLAGLDSGSYELTAAVASILRQDGAEARYLAGEPILADVPGEGPVPPEYEAAIQAMVAQVAPTL
jgi:hypothetical protein